MLPKWGRDLPWGLQQLGVSCIRDPSVDSVSECLIAETDLVLNHASSANVSLQESAL